MYYCTLGYDDDTSSWTGLGSQRGYSTRRLQAIYHGASFTHDRAPRRSPRPRATQICGPVAVHSRQSSVVESGTLDSWYDYTGRPDKLSLEPAGAVQTPCRPAQRSLCISPPAGNTGIGSSPLPPRPRRPLCLRFVLNSWNRAAHRLLLTCCEKLNEARKL